MPRKRDPEYERLKRCFSERMRELMPKGGPLSQAELARRIGTDPSQVGRYYWGRVLPDPSRQLDIARELGVSVSRLRGEDE